MTLCSFSVSQYTVLTFQCFSLSQKGSQYSQQLHQCLDLDNLLSDHHHQEEAGAFDSPIAMVRSPVLVTIGSGGGVGVTLLETAGIGDQLRQEEN